VNINVVINVDRLAYSVWQWSGFWYCLGPCRFICMQTFRVRASECGTILMQHTWSELLQHSNKAITTNHLRPIFNCRPIYSAYIIMVVDDH